MNIIYAELNKIGSKWIYDVSPFTGKKVSLRLDKQETHLLNIPPAFSASASASGWSPP